MSTDADARDYVMNLGHLHVPVVVTDDGHHWSGYRSDGMKHAVAGPPPDVTRVYLDPR